MWVDVFLAGCLIFMNHCLCKWPNYMCTLTMSIVFFSFKIITRLVKYMINITSISVIAKIPHKVVVQLLTTAEYPIKTQSLNMTYRVYTDVRLQIHNKHTIVYTCMFCSKWTSHSISHLRHCLWSQGTSWLWSYDSLDSQLPFVLVQSIPIAISIWVQIPLMGRCTT